MRQRRGRLGCRARRGPPVSFRSWRRPPRGGSAWGWLPDARSRGRGCRGRKCRGPLGTGLQAVARCCWAPGAGEPAHAWCRNSDQDHSDQRQDRRTPQQPARRNARGQVSRGVPEQQGSHRGSGPPVVPRRRRPPLKAKGTVHPQRRRSVARAPRNDSAERCRAQRCRPGDPASRHPGGRSEPDGHRHQQAPGRAP